jgi:chloride channel 7
MIVKRKFLSIGKICYPIFFLFIHLIIYFKNHIRGGKSFFAIWELIMFMIVGCLGGLLGAIFNESTEHIVAWRMKYINKKKKLRLVEALLLATAFSIVFFSIPLMWNQCTEKPQDIQDWSEQEKNLVERLVAFKCKEGQYNEVASLIFTDADNAMKQLLHFRDDGTSFSSAALFLFFVPYFIFVTLAYGSGVPAGLFVPSLLAGAGFGRMCGHLLHKLSPGTFADAGTYALMGAAAILGGMSRMTISITVILLEVTGDMEFVLPLMLTLMCARFSGNVFGESCYDILIHLKHIPFLEADVPSIVDKHDMVAGQVMNTDVKCLQPVERVGVVYDLLKSCSHRVFPVVDMASNGTLYGTVSRDVLCTLMQRRAFGKTYQPDRVLGSKRLSPLVSWDTIEQAYPDYPTINDVLMRHIDRERTLDLRPYANTAPYTINETASIQRTYRLFRTLGLRCLCVVNHNNKVVGVITRKDLLPDALSRALLRGRLAHYTEADDHHTEAPGDANIMEPPIDMKRVKALMKKQDYEITEYDDDYSDDHVDDGRTVL